MDTWTLQMGYPVVNVERNYETQSVSFQQKRYSTIHIHSIFIIKHITFLFNCFEFFYERFLINPNSTSDGSYAWFVPLSWTVPHHPSGKVIIQNIQKILCRFFFFYSFHIDYIFNRYQKHETLDNRFQ